MSDKIKSAREQIIIKNVFYLTQLTKKLKTMKQIKILVAITLLIGLSNCTKTEQIKVIQNEKHLQIQVEGVDKDGTLTLSKIVPLTFQE